MELTAQFDLYSEVNACARGEQRCDVEKKNTTRLNRKTDNERALSNQFREPTVATAEDKLNRLIGGEVSTQKIRRSKTSYSEWRRKKD